MALSIYHYVNIVDINLVREVYTRHNLAVNVFNAEDRTVVIKPFSYSVIPDLENLCRKSDQYLLR